MKANEIRLNRYLAMCEVASRRKCDELISQGLVKVNGNVVTRMGARIEPDKDEVEFKGEKVVPRENNIYILLNKPLRTITSTKDESRRKTVVDIVRLEERIFPVGRLDYNTTGALLLTNDGDMSYFLSHPKFEVSKKYRVMLNDRIRPIDLYHFRNGIDLDGRKTAPCRVEELRIIDNCSYLDIELHEGRNRQIRRMFSALGYKIRELHRIEYAGLNVQNLKAGEWRRLTSREVKMLKTLVAERKQQIMQEADEAE